MRIELSAKSQQFVDEQVALGNYVTPQEVVDAAIVALARQQERLAELRNLLQPAIDECDRGESTPIDAEEIKRLGREQLKLKDAHSKK